MLLMYWHEWIINVTLLTELAMKENICVHVTLMMTERKDRGRSPWKKIVMFPMLLVGILRELFKGKKFVDFI